MSVPEQVAKEAEEADRVMTEMFGTTDEQTGTTDEAPKEDTATAPETAEEPKADKVDEPKPETQAAEGDIESLKAELAEVKQNLSMTAGRLRVVADENKTLKAEIARLQKGPTEEDRAQSEKLDEFQKDFPDVHEQLTLRDRTIAELRAEISSLKEALYEPPKQAESKPSEFIAQLTEQVSNWRQVRDDPKFLEYLNQEDPETGIRRYDIAAKANKERNAARLAKVYQGYIDGAGAAASTKKEQLAKRIAPDRPVGASATKVDNPEATKTYSRKAVEQFYRDVQNRKYLGREAEARKLEALYEKAAYEGRIVDP